MTHKWALRCQHPADLVTPVSVSPQGPTKQQARGPHWRRTSPGFYVPASLGTPSVEQRVLESVTRAHPAPVLTGWAALRWRGANLFDGIAPDGRSLLPVDLAVPVPGHLKPSPGIRWHRRVLKTPVTEVHGVPCVAGEEAAWVAMSCASSWREATAILDGALAAGEVDLDLMEALIGRLRGHRWITRARLALAFAEPRTRSPAETAMRLVWQADAGYPRPLCNWPIADEHGVFVASPDLLCVKTGVVGEYDGAGHRDAATQADDITRSERYNDLGLEVFRIVSRDARIPHGVLTKMQRAVRRARELDRPRLWQVAVDPPPLK